ncbi:Structural maintenance of chromosomes protein 6 [Grifola frondosa]|uniref:Structural maintenance of chromosomes protein 6 n=1 Tax=Grifola frondosa TaxID=5627 RepID=A0A1C7LW33_GRIFR|nr:Structural maintenance of chromosomes protein 6 [Grifola frondosa]
MPKRRAVAIHSESDEDIVSEGSPAVKRARTEAESDSEDVGTKPTNRATRSKGKSRRRRDEDVQVDDEDVEVGQFEPDEDEEKRFEEEHEDEIRERLMHKGKSQGGIAEMGIIESLEMHQFMCHKYLTFTMGPQINFIIGHNGSGKSAVLSALTVALGGKATSTGRGTGLKSFIREGQNVAEVTVVLKNQGEEAYRPKDYGKSIVITRRFNKDGGSSYKIKSKDGKAISTKREELSAICDHMNIQVDNPMNILTQDSARQFLSASQPGDKYRFFLRGTQLSQLSEEYQTCMENISQTQKVLKRKSEVIPDLQEALSEATARFQEASKAREQRHKADELKKELAWAHVAVKEEEMTAKFEEVAKLKRRLSKIQESSRQAESEVEECRASIAKLEQERADLGDRGDLVTKRDALQDQIRANAQKLLEFNREEKEMEDSKRKLDSIIAGLKSQIEAEEKRIQEFSQGKRDETNRKLEEANAELKQAEEHLNSIRAEINQKRVDCDSASQEGRTLESEVHQMKDRIVNCEQQLEMSRAQEKNKLAQFGRNMESVLAEIQKGRWYGRQPAGPFGTYVKVKDPKQWAPLLRIQIGGMMSGFAITDARDRKALDKILRDHGNGNCPIIISEVDMFDYSQGEPPESYLTILRALEISDPYVLRVLVNALHIESTLLAPTRAEADSTLRSMGRGGVACAADLYRVVRFPEGGGQSSIIQPLQGSDIRHQLFTGGNVEAEIKRWTVERDALNTQLSTLNGRIQELKRDYAQWRHAIESLQRQESSLQQEVRRLKTVRDNLMLEVNDEMPAGVQGLQAALLEQEADKELLLAQFVQLTRNKLQVNEEQHPLMDKKDKVKAQLSEFSEKETALHAQLEAMGVKFKKLQNDIEFYAKKVKPEEDMIAAR